MSQQLVWEIVKNNNAFLVKNSGLTLSKDPYNNTGIQTYSSCGFITNDGLGVVGSQTKHVNNFTVLSKKRVQYRQKTKAVPAPAKGGKVTKDKIDVTIYNSSLPVKHGLHTVSRIIRKRLGARRIGYQRAALRKLVKLNRANAIKRRNEDLAAKQQKK